MAINPSSEYVGQIDITSDPTGYPYGKAQNVETPGDGKGTPLEKAWVNDFFGFIQALLAEQQVVPSGTPEKVGASQLLDLINDKLGVTGSSDNKIKWVKYRCGARANTVSGSNPNSALDTVGVAGLEYWERDTEPQADYRFMSWAGNGLNLYMASQTTLYWYTTSTPFDLGSIVYQNSFASLAGLIEGISVKEDGSAIYYNSGSIAFAKRTFGTAYDVTTLGTETAGTNPTTQDNDMADIWVSPDELVLYCVGRQNAQIYRYDFGVAGDVTSLVFDASYTPDSNLTNDVWGLDVSPDGKHFLIADDSLTSPGRLASYTFPDAPATWPGNAIRTGRVIPPLMYPAGTGVSWFAIRGCSWNADGSRVIFSDNTIQGVFDCLIAVPYI